MTLWYQKKPSSALYLDPVSNCFKIFLLPFLLISSAYCQEQITTTEEPMFIGKAKTDCKCKKYSFGDDEGEISFKKNTVHDRRCAEIKDKKNFVWCDNNFPDSIECSSRCFELVQKLPLTKEENIASVKKTERDARKKYSETVPEKILKSISKKHPHWYPVLVNTRDNPSYFADFKLHQDFYFQAPIRLEGKIIDVSVVYFYPDINSLWKESTSWSFWNSNTGDLLYENTTPYKPLGGGGYQHPCLALAGEKLDEVVLSGTMSGATEATGCCGPYVLNDLKKSGPILMDKMKHGDCSPDTIWKKSPK